MPYTPIAEESTVVPPSGGYTSIDPSSVPSPSPLGHYTPIGATPVTPGSGSSITPSSATVTAAINSIKTPSLLSRIGSGIKTFANNVVAPLVDVSGVIDKAIGVPENQSAPRPPALQAPLLTSKSADDINKSIADLNTAKSKVDTTSQDSVDAYNAQVQKVQSNITQYNAAQKAQNAISGNGIIPVASNTASAMLDPIASIPSEISPELSKVLNEPIDIAGSALGSTSVFQNLAKGADEGKFLPSFIQSLASRLQVGTQAISGATGGLIQPNIVGAPDDASTKLLSVISQGVGMFAGLGALESTMGLTAPQAILDNFQNYPKIQAIFNGLASSIPAFATYGQLNPQLNTAGDRLKTLGTDILTAIPYTALGLIGNKALQVPASAALGFGMAKLSGASNKDAAVSATALGLLSLIGASGKDSQEIVTQAQAKGQLYNEALDTINKFSDLKITPDSSTDEIKSAFKNAALKTHPDVGGDAKDFSAVTYARDVLLGNGKTTEATVNNTPTPEEAKAEVQKMAEDIKNPPQTESNPEIKKQVDDIALNYRKIEPESVDSTLSQNSPNIVPVKSLRTFDFHEMEGQPQTDEENAKIHKNIVNSPEKPMVPGGESFNKAAARGLTTVRNILSTEKGKNVAITTHNSMFGLIELWAKNGQPNTLDKNFREKYVKQDNSNPTGSSFVIKNGDGNIYVVRHGETVDNAQHLFRRATTALTDKGRDQAADLGEELKGKDITKIYSSDLPRAIETSQIIQRGINGLDKNNQQIDTEGHERSSDTSNNADRGTNTTGVSGERNVFNESGATNRSTETANGGNKESESTVRSDGEGTQSAIGGSGRSLVYGGESEIRTRETAEDLRRRGTDDEVSLAVTREVAAGVPLDIDKHIYTILKNVGFSPDFIEEVRFLADKKAFSKIALTNQYHGESGYYAVFDSTNDVLVLNPTLVNSVKFQDNSILRHEVSGHSWFGKLSPEGKKAFYETLKKNPELIKEAWQKEENPHAFYWKETVLRVYNEIKNTNSVQIADRIIKDFSLEVDPNITLDEFINRTLNIDKKIDAINKELERLGENKINLKAEDTSGVTEHVAMLAENANTLIPTDDAELTSYINDVRTGELKYGPNAEKSLIYTGEGTIPDELKSLMEKARQTDNLEDFIKENSARDKMGLLSPYLGEERLTEIYNQAQNLNFRKTEDLDQLRKMLEREEQSVAIAEANPSGFADVYGENKLEEHKAKITELKQRIADAKHPVDISPRDALARTEKRIGVKPVNINMLKHELNKAEQTLKLVKANPASFEENKIPLQEEKITELQNQIKEEQKIPMVRVSKEGIQLPDELYGRKIALEAQREALENSPYGELEKYVAQSGAFKGELPEVLSRDIKKTDKFYGKIRNPNVLNFIKNGDTIIDDVFGVGNKTSEEVREGMQKYLEDKEAFKEEDQAVRQQINNYIDSQRDIIALNKLAERDSQKEAKDIAIEKRRTELDKAQKRVEAGIAKIQDLRDKIEKNFIIPDQSRKMSILNPLKSQDEEFRKIFQKFTRTNAEATNVGLQYANSMPSIDKLGIKAFDDFEDGVAFFQKEVAGIFDKLYEYGINHGFEGMTKIYRYLPHVYKNTPDQVDGAIRQSLKDKGLSPTEIEAYLNGKKLNPDESVHLKLNPFFSKERYFKTYQEAATYGLEPKYDKMSDLISRYHRDLLQTSATRTLANDLEDSGKRQLEQFAPRNWQPAKYGPQGIKGYFFSPREGNFLDNYFQGYENPGFSAPIIRTMSSLSKFLQRMALSTGLPFTSVDPFAIGISVKELTRGNAKVINSLIKSNSNTASIKSLQDDYKYVEMMARNGISMRPIGNQKFSNYETIPVKFGKLKLGVKTHPFKLGSYKPVPEIMTQALNNIFGKKTFANFLPLLNVQVFKDSYNGLIKKDVPDEIAQQIAAEITRNILGLPEDVGRSRMTHEAMSAFFFAPEYREGIINVLLNSAKSISPFKESGENGPNGEKTTKGRPIGNKEYSLNRNLLLGMALTFAVYALLNKKLTGHEIWDNSAGHQGDLQIPLSNGQIIFIPFMPSFMTVPRLAVGAIDSTVQGDLPSALAQFGQTLSTVAQMTLDALTNKNYYGSPIWKPTDTIFQKWGKVGAFLGLEFNHPYVKAVVAAIEGQISKSPVPIWQSIITATQLPLKFSTVAKEQTNDVFTAIANQATAQAQTTLDAEGEFASLKALAATDQTAANAKFSALVSSNPTLAEQVYKIAQDDKAGITATDRAIKLLGVKDGARANYIYNEAMKLSTNDQKNAYINDLINKKIISQNVYDQLVQITKSGGKPITPPADTGNNNNGDATFEGHPTYYGTPDASKIIGGNSDDGTIASYNPNHEPIYQRFSEATSEAIKKELFNSDPYWKANGYTMGTTQLDHIVPIEAGGTMTKDNLQLISQAADDANNPMEDYLGAQYKAGKISRADAAKASIDYKINKTVTLTDIENGKY